MRYEKRTDLAIEVKESFPKDHVEIPGVSLQENYDKLKKIKVTSVQIMNHIGARQMKKPIGTYTTIDFEERFIFEQKDYMDAVGKRLQKELASYPAAQNKEGCHDIGYRAWKSFCNTGCIGTICLGTD